MKVDGVIGFDLRNAGRDAQAAEAAGYSGVWTAETGHDPFFPLLLAAEHTEDLELGTSIAVAFARNPMLLANVGWDLQAITGGRFVLGLGTQVRPHIERRFGAVWSHPVERMRELVQAIRAIWATWEGQGPLRFEGAHYRHTLMIPAFDPGPNPFGPPPIWLGGVGPRMIEAAGEVADGFIAHPFATRRSLTEHVMPALARGLARAGRRRADLQVICATIVVTAEDDAELARIRRAVKKQLAFYGSTPAYRPTLACEGYDELHGELNRLSKAGRWDDMTDLVDDALLDAVAVVGPRREVAARLHARLADLADGVSLTNNRAPDPSHWADVVADLRALSL